jgi:toxin FitB
MSRSTIASDHRAMRWLLDTNILSELLKNDPDQNVFEWVDRQPKLYLYISSITIMEIRYGLSRMPAGSKRAAREAAFDAAVLHDFERRVLPFDHDCAETAGRLAAARENIGRPVRGNDTMIAGIALANRMGIVTRNAGDFHGLDVPVVNPFDG